LGKGATAAGEAAAPPVGGETKTETGITSGNTTETDSAIGGMEIGAAPTRGWTGTGEADAAVVTGNVIIRAATAVRERLSDSADFSGSKRRKRVAFKKES
jgi:hypothetical protein